MTTEEIWESLHRDLDVVKTKIVDVMCETEDEEFRGNLQTMVRSMNDMIQQYFHRGWRR